MTDMEYVYQVLEGEIAGDQDELQAILNTLSICSVEWVDCLTAIDKAKDRAEADKYRTLLFASARG